MHTTSTPMTNVIFLTISHVAGKDIAIVNVLTRAPFRQHSRWAARGCLFVDSVMASLPAMQKRHREIQSHKDDDIIIITAWKDDQASSQFEECLIDIVFKPYLPFSGEIMVQNGMLLHGIRIVILTSLRADVLHKDHLWITKCRES